MSDNALYIVAMCLLIGAVPVGAACAYLSIWFDERKRIK